MLNGLPALVARLPAPAPGYAPLVVTRVELDGAGRLTRAYSVLATRKLTAIGAGDESWTERETIA